MHETALKYGNIRKFILNHEITELWKYGSSYQKRNYRNTEIHVKTEITDLWEYGKTTNTNKRDKEIAEIQKFMGWIKTKSLCTQLSKIE